MYFFLVKNICGQFVFKGKSVNSVVAEFVFVQCHATFLLNTALRLSIFFLKISIRVEDCQVEPVNLRPHRKQVNWHFRRHRRFHHQWHRHRLMHRLPLRPLVVALNRPRTTIQTPEKKYTSNPIKLFAAMLFTWGKPDNASFNCRPSSSNTCDTTASDSSSSPSSSIASSMCSLIISSFMSIISDCFSNSCRIFWICGKFNCRFMLCIALVTPAE